jgi:hypothetical protein
MPYRQPPNCLLLFLYLANETRVQLTQADHGKLGNARLAGTKSIGFVYA